MGLKTVLSIKRLLKFKISPILDLKFLVFFLFVTGNLFSQITLNDSLKIEKIIKKGNNKKRKWQTITVSEANEVIFINDFINKTSTQPLQRDRLYKINDRKTIGGRYKQADKSVLSEVINILNSNDYDSIEELLDQLEQKYDDTILPYKLNDVVKNKLFDLINIPELESSIIYFLVNQEIEDRSKLFEKRLLTGKSTQEELLIEKLCLEKEISDTIVNFLCENIRKNKLEIDTISIIFEIYNKSSFIGKKKFTSTLYDYLEKNPLILNDFKSLEINNEDIQDTTNQESDSLVVDTLVSKNNRNHIDIDRFLKIYIIFEILRNGDERNIIFIEKIKVLLSKKEISESQKVELENLIEFIEFPFKDIKDKKQILINKIKRKDSFYYYEKIFSDNDLKFDLELQIAILENGEKLEVFQNENMIKEIKSKFSFLETKVFLELIEKNIKSNEIKSKFLIDNYSLDLKIKWLSDNGFKTIENTNQQKIDFLKSIREDNRDNIFSALSINRIGLDLYPEHIFLTENYNLLIEKFIALSDGKIKNVKSCIQYVFDDHFQKLSPRVFLSYKNKCYIIIPEQYSEFCYLQQLRIVLDLITKESGIKEKYFFFDKNLNNESFGEYCIFGQKDLIEKIAKNYNINISIDPYKYEEFK